MTTTPRSQVSSVSAVPNKGEQEKPITKGRKAVWDTLMAAPLTDHPQFKTLGDAINTARQANFGFTTLEGTFWIAPISFLPQLRDSILCSTRPWGSYAPNTGPTNQEVWKKQCADQVDQFYRSLWENGARDIRREDFDAAVQAARDALAPLIEEEKILAKAQGEGRGA